MNTSETVSYRANIRASLDSTTKLRWPHNYGAYRLADHDLARGSTLGAPTVQISLKASGALEHVYCVDAGKKLLGTFLLKHWDDRDGMKLASISGHFYLYPEHQEHRYMLSNGVYVRENVFVRSRGPQENGEIDPPAVYYAVEFTNDSEETQRMATYAFGVLTIDVCDEVEATYDETLRAFVVHGKGKDTRKETRIIGSDRKPKSYEISLDHAKSVTATHPGKLSGTTEAPAGLPTAILHYVTTLERGETAHLTFCLTVGADGVDAAKKAYTEAPKAAVALKETQHHYHDTLSSAVPLTPNGEINRGCLWAKANMERVLLKPKGNWAFTNDPTDSTNCVGRDAAWFCAGTDYFRPDFSRACLDQFIGRQEESGMMIEYFDMLSGKTEDFGLNINDDTPLLVWALWHHVACTGDAEFLDRAYEAVLKAGRYIAKQRDERGLVWCTSEETGSKGIISWRNVIQNYRISGAVTEVNSECYAAFRCIAQLAQRKGDDDAVREFSALAEDLRRAINQHLFNPNNGLYYLNIDVDGTPRTDVTADLIFPVMFGVADKDTAARIIRRLSDEDFWTPGGMRTIPHDALNYSPLSDSGCLGGVWNGMTFWYAKAAAEYIPDFSEEGLTNGFENYARNPQRNNTVPGQFSEWLHGETLVNEGMTLSPWFPPRYLWAVIEGVLGLNISGERLRIEPHLSSRWTWCGLRNLPFREKRLTWFAARTPELHIWTNERADSPCAIEVLAEDLSERCQASGDDVVTAALADGSRILAIAGNTSDRTATTAVRIDGLEQPHSARRYDSLGNVWYDDSDWSADELQHGRTLQIEPKGFQLLEFRPKGS